MAYGLHGGVGFRLCFSDLVRGMPGTGMSFTVQPTVTAQGQQPLCVAVGATGRVQTTRGACS